MGWLNSSSDWVGMNLSELQETVEGKGSGVLQSTEVQRAGHNLAAEQ